MIRITDRVRGLGVVSGLLLACGCMSHKPQQSTTKAEGTDVGGVLLAPPQIYFEGGLMVVKGTAHADAASSNDIAGAVDVEILGPTGEVIKRIGRVGFDTRTVPSDPTRLATYEMRFDEHPTQDESVRVRFVDPATAASEDAGERGTTGM